MSVAAGPKKLNKGDILFREGDPSDAMYVVKSGKISITKNKGDKDIELASLNPGQMFGEMAFFDNQPRSANAKAAADSVVVALPFASLLAQFKTFPEWLKVMVRTINDNLRDANKRIKNLEKVDGGDRFPPYTITKLCATLGLVASRYGKKEGEGVVIPGTLLRRYTVQIFQEATSKMQDLMGVLQDQKFISIEDVGGDQQKITILKLEELIQFVEYYNEYLFKEESKRTTIERHELMPLRALVHYAKNAPTEKDGTRKADLTMIKDKSQAELGQLVKLEDFESLIYKKAISQKMAEPSGAVTAKINYEEISQFYSNWSLVYAIQALDKKG